MLTLIATSCAISTLMGCWLLCIIGRGDRMSWGGYSLAFSGCANTL
jgi:hypothetical protein